MAAEKQPPGTDVSKRATCLADTYEVCYDLSCRLKVGFGSRRSSMTTCARLIAIRRGGDRNSTPKSGALRHATLQSASLPSIAMTSRKVSGTLAVTRILAPEDDRSRMVQDIVDCLLLKTTMAPFRTR